VVDAITGNRDEAGDQHVQFVLGLQRYGHGPVKAGMGSREVMGQAPDHDGDGPEIGKGEADEDRGRQRGGF
jgi:hypothetical protein